MGPSVVGHISVLLVRNQCVCADTCVLTHNNRCPVSLRVPQAISNLSHLTLITSLTPPWEPLQSNPTRPHPGCDLATLSCKGVLRGLDVAVMVPEHLAAVGQFTALQRLTLR